MSISRSSPEPRMQIAIVGAGAMGSYFGARLAAAGNTVTLLDPNTAHMDAIGECGLVLVDGQPERSVVDVAATADPARVPSADLVVILTKAHNVSDAARTAAAFLAASGVVLVLSNGIGCAEAAAAWVHPEKIFYGATAAGAVLEEPGVVRHHVEGLTCFGSYVPDRGRRTAEVLSQVLNAAGIEAQAVDDPDEWIWTKLMINIAYNAATALTRVRNGELVRDPDGRAVLEAAVAEALVVARAKGIHIKFADPLAAVIDVGLGSISPNQSSMLQDVLAGRTTEIDYLNGAVVREGERIGIATPVNETLMRLVRLVDRRHGGDPQADSKGHKDADNLSATVLLP